MLEFSLKEALSFGHEYIGTEHILLGLARENAGVATQILLDFEVDAETVRNEVLGLLSGRRLGRTMRPSVARTRPAFFEDVSRRLSTAPLVEWSGIVAGALALAAGVLIGWLIWG